MPSADADPLRLRIPPDDAVTGEENKILRVKASYSDVHDDDKVVYARTTVPVRAQPATECPSCFH